MEPQKILEQIKSSGRNAEEVLKMAYDMQRSIVLYESGIQEVRTKLEILQREAQIKGGHTPIETIKSRVKNVFSVLEKLERKGFEVSMKSVEENLHDVAGIRVICPYIEDIYEVAEWLHRQDDLRILIEKDYIKNPKPNGYRSFHMVVEVPVFLADSKRYVRVEIQLRTIAMEFWASLEHQIRYKGPEAVPESISSKLRHCAQTIAAIDEQMLEIYKEVRALLDKEV